MAICAAILVGVGLGYLQVKEGWPPEMMSRLTNLSGLPVSILALSYVFFRRGWILVKTGH